MSISSTRSATSHPSVSIPPERTSGSFGRILFPSLSLRREEDSAPSVFRHVAMCHITDDVNNPNLVRVMTVTGVFDDKVRRYVIVKPGNVPTVISGFIHKREPNEPPIVALPIGSNLGGNITFDLDFPPSNMRL